MILLFMLTLLIMALIGRFLGGLKFDLFGFLVTKVNWYVFFFNIKFNRGTRNFFFLSHDPIGWRFEVFFRIFSKSYDQNYAKYMSRINEGGAPVSKQELRGSFGKFGKRVKAASRTRNLDSQHPL